MPRGGPTAGEGPPGMRTTGPGAVSAFNPVYAVELGPEETPEGQRWSPAEAARFLAATAAGPLGLMFRLVVLRGFRRGEAVARGPITPVSSVRRRICSGIVGCFTPRYAATSRPTGARHGP